MVGISYDEESKTEILDEGPFEVLHIHGFPSEIVPAVNKYNREHRGPDGNAINITMTCIDALRKELKKREHPLQSMTHIPNVGPVELKRAADLIKELGYKPLEDIDGNRLEIGDKVGFTIAGPDANNYLQGNVCRRDNEYWIYCGTPGLIKIDNDLLNLHLLPDDEPGLKGRDCQCIVVDEGTESPECSVCDERADDRAQTKSVMSYTDRSIWLCPRCMTIITDLEYRHLNMLGRCTECETALVQYEKVEWRP